MRDEYIDSLCEELKRRSGYLDGEKISTIYFGGGTPSQLTHAHINKVFRAIVSNYDVSSNAEITLEANPDDVNDEFADVIASTMVNRISMGVQSFDDSILRLLQRRHSAEQACMAVEKLRRARVDNISIDLIYGLPGQTIDGFDHDLSTAFSLDVEHLSAYSLSYEVGTKLWMLRERKELVEAPEELSLEMYRLLLQRVAENGFEHYEISNFCKPGLFSRHNSSYWHGEAYLGVGASAHSFNGKSRRWNVANIDKYIKGVKSNSNYSETENLSLYDRYNEYLQTGLRTRDGVDLDELKEKFGNELYGYCMKQVLPNLKTDRLKLVSQRLSLSADGLFVSDDVISDLFFVD